MNKVLCLFLVAAALYGVAESLVCYTCDKALLGKCLSSSNITCPANKPNCYVGKAKFAGISNFIGFYTQGCLATETCNRTMAAKLLGVSYNVTYECCDTSLCFGAGGASTVHLSLATSAALLFSLWNSVRC